MFVYVWFVAKILLTGYCVRIQPLANDLYHYGAGVLIIWGGFVICKAVVGRAVAAIGPILPDDTLVENATLHRVKVISYLYCII